MLGFPPMLTVVGAALQVKLPDLTDNVALAAESETHLQHWQGSFAQLMEEDGLNVFVDLEY